MLCRHQFTLVAATICICLLPGVVLGQGDPEEAPTIKWEPKQVLKFRDRPSSFGFCGDGKRFVCNDGKSARMWDTKTWKEVRGHTIEKGHIGVIGLSPDGGVLAFTAFSSDGAKQVHLLELASGRLLQTFRPHDGNAWARLSPVGKSIVTFALNDGLRLWEVETGKNLERFNKLDRFSKKYEELCGLVFSPDGRTLAVSTEDGIVHFVDVEQGKEVRQFAPIDPAFRTLISPAFSRDGRYMAVPGGQNIVTIWDVRAARRFCEIRWPVSKDPEELAKGRPALLPDPKRPPGVCDLAFAPDGRSLITICSDHRIRVWEVSTGGLRYYVDEPAVNMLKFSPAGTLFAAADAQAETREVFVWDFRTCVPRRRPSSPLDLDKAWPDIAIKDAALAYQCMRHLAATPKETVVGLDKRLRTADPVEASVIEGLVNDLDDKSFKVRERAARQLADLGEIAKPALAQALSKKPSAEAGKRMKEILDGIDGLPVGDRLRFVRAIEVLEMIGTHEVRSLLKRLSDGHRDALLTREAKAALDRLNWD